MSRRRRWPRYVRWWSAASIAFARSSTPTTACPLTWSSIFRELGPAWCEAELPGARQLLEKYNIPLPDKVEQHDLAEAERRLGWRPDVGFLDFLRDLQGRDARGDDVTGLWVPGELPA